MLWWTVWIFSTQQDEWHVCHDEKVYEKTKLFDRYFEHSWLFHSKILNRNVKTIKVEIKFKTIKVKIEFKNSILDSGWTYYW